mmetsp:Transcript_28391/g.51256  ORF Transcript_28391/g.51256 Transcript_28391/m.51256 type:complete len:247 (+) Transcript_28391:52-792(+)
MEVDSPRLLLGGNVLTAQAMAASSPATTGKGMPESTDVSTPRPKSARYMRRWAPGSTGGSIMAATLGSNAAPLSPPGMKKFHPDASPMDGHTKTERWREAGVTRWPPISEGQDTRQPADVVPLRRYIPTMQPRWQGELWTRSLRKPGVLVQHPVFASSSVGVQELHEEWGDLLPNSPREWPFSGSTASGKAGMPNARNAKHWVERPVATGKYALDHMGGERYSWARDSRPRPCLDGVTTPRIKYTS